MQRLIITIFFIFLLGTGYSQNEKNGFGISLKSGMTFANMYGSDVKSETFLNGSDPESFYANHPASDKFKPGFNIGVNATYRFNKYFSLGIGTSYIRKGAKINATKHWVSDAQTYEEVEGNIYWMQNYFTIELPLSFYIPVKENDFFITAGLFQGFLNKSEEKGKITLSGKEYEYVNNRRANKTEPGFFLSGGYIYSIPGNASKLFIELTWSRSIIKSVGSDLIPNPQYYYNQTISINIGYKYNLR